MVTLKNSEITVQIDEKGAELKSLKCGGTEYIWHGVPEIWDGSAPILFPICSSLKDNKYIYRDKEYQMCPHGYIKNKLFEVETVTDTRAVFLHRSDEETKKSYPFDYEFRAIFELNGQALDISYEVKNLGDSTMYFNTGSHEAYYTPEGIEDYDVIFDTEETLDTYLLCGSVISDKYTMPIIKDSRVLPLYDKYFMLDTLIFKDVKSKGAVLRNRKTGRAVRVDFPDAPYFMLWHMVGAPYICLEPWNGICEIAGSSYDITEKEGITVLDAGKTFNFRHSVTVIE